MWKADWQPLKGRDRCAREGLNVVWNEWRKREERAIERKWAREYREKKRESSVSLSSVRALLIWWQRLPLSPWRILAVSLPLATNNITAHYWCTHIHTHPRKHTQRRENNTLNKHSHAYSGGSTRFFYTHTRTQTHTHTHTHTQVYLLCWC